MNELSAASGQRSALSDQRSGTSTSKRLQLFPSSPVYSRLLENPGEQFQSDVSMMGIGNPQAKAPLQHELVLAPGVGTIET
jgi:hypothetical protein